uniref:Uncharacterized protein n=1 Tax=Anguilla anguilla TaxID=7936 RepID=A0A0E9T0Z0_ANGAN
MRFAKCWQINCCQLQQSNNCRDNGKSRR